MLLATAFRYYGNRGVPGRRLLAVTAGAADLRLAGCPARAAGDWVQGSHYFLIRPALPTKVSAGKVEVTEVFSYACPACNRFYPAMDQLRAGCRRMPSSPSCRRRFTPDEDWPMFQRAFYAAQALEVDRRTHDAMFDAIWKTGELAIFEPGYSAPQGAGPGIEDAARCYARGRASSARPFRRRTRFGVDTRFARQISTSGRRRSTRPRP